MSEKKALDYQKLIKHLDIKPEEFLMIGNSIKSDVLPVLELGGYGVHVPYHTTWAYEQVEHNINNPNFRKVESIVEILPFCWGRYSIVFLPTLAVRKVKLLLKY